MSIEQDKLAKDAVKEQQSGAPRIRPGSTCRVCHKEIPLFCSGTHGVGGGGSDDGEEGEESTHTEQQTADTREHAVIPTQKSLRPLTDNLFNITFVPKGRTFTKEQLEKFLAAEIYATPEELKKIQLLFESYVKRLEAAQIEGFSREDYHAEMTSDGTLSITMPSRHKESFLELLLKQNIPLTFVAQDRTENTSRLNPIERILNPKLAMVDAA